MTAVGVSAVRAARDSIARRTVDAFRSVSQTAPAVSAATTVAALRVALVRRVQRVPPRDSAWHL
jgi:hypothetical protein